MTPQIPREEDPIFQSSPAARLNILDVQNVKKLPRTLSEIHTIKGEGGKSGKDGQDGKDGYTPKKGKDYFTQKEILAMVKTIQSLIPVPQDGKTPILGVDYFTDADIQDIINAVLSNIREPKDGKDAVIDYEYVIKEVLAKIPTPKDGKRGPRGPQGPAGMDGKDADIKELYAEAKKQVEEHEKKFDHTELHDSKILGTKEIDEETIGDRKFIQYDEDVGKLVYTTITVKKGKKGTYLSGGGGTTLPSRAGNSGKFLSTDGTKLTWSSPVLDIYVPYTGATDDVDLGSHNLTVTDCFVNGDLTIRLGQKVYMDG